MSAIIKREKMPKAFLQLKAECVNYYKSFQAKIQFGEYYKDFSYEMIRLLKKYKKEGKKAAVWGGGLKGNAFLSAVDARAKYIEAVIDMNPSLQGTVLATGHKVVGKEYVLEHAVDVVFIMSELYFVENYFTLKKMGYQGDIFDVDYLVKHKINCRQIYRNDFKQVDLNDDKLFGYDLSEIHEKLLEILEEVDRICREYSIPYFLEAGSALGAYRYNGFLPCDDDIDIAMLRKDYERFLKIAPKRLKAGFLLQKMEKGSEYLYPFAQVVMDNTCFVREEFKNLKMHMGIHIDVAPLDTVSANPKKQAEQFERVRRITKLIRSRTLPEQFQSQNPFKCFVVNSKYYLLNLIPMELLRKRQKQEFMKYSHLDTGYVGDLCTHYKKVVAFKKDSLLPAAKMCFEGRKYPVPRDIESYLGVIYGEYKTLSPREKGSVKYNLTAVSLSENYKRQK